MVFQGALWQFFFLLGFKLEGKKLILLYLDRKQDLSHIACTGDQNRVQTYCGKQKRIES